MIAIELTKQNKDKSDESEKTS